MSYENGGSHLIDQLAESNCEIKRKLKLSYSREFLLSLSGLDICKKLPSGFDESILSEFEDVSRERPRIPGSLSSHGFRRTEYGSPPPTKGELGNYNRGTHGRWESRSSGKSDKDADSQSDRDSDSGGRYGNPSRRGWQAPEHDGLLGSGSFPRPSGYVPGTSAPKFRSNDNYQLNRSTEPYQPPRPYKAVPHSRRETNDSYNDETFGASECTSEDKVEEERKRRASFELMRKEQHKAFQERNKMNMDKRRDDFDITTLLEDSKDEKGPLNKDSETDEAIIAQESTRETAKSSILSQSPATRPLVPPGFAGAVQEKKSHPGEVKMVSADKISHGSETSMFNAPPNDLGRNQMADQMSLNVNQHGNTGIQNLFIGKTDKDVLPALDISDRPSSKKNRFGADSDSNVLESCNSDTVQLDSGNAAGNKVIAQSGNPSTILEKLFGSAVAVETGISSTISEQQEDKGDDTWSPGNAQSSKFARWFLDEDRKPMDDPMSRRPGDLFSLIVGGERSSSDSDMQVPEQLWPKSVPLGSQSMDGHMSSDVATATINKSDSKSEAISAVLTCEDLENSILSGISDSGKATQPLLPPEGSNNEETQTLNANIDDHASQHLLSLLQKGPGDGDMVPVPHVDTKSSYKLDSFEAESAGKGSNNLKEAHDTALSNSGQSLILESLFGTAFMKELQSVEAPVSAQRVSAGSARVETLGPHGFPINQVDGILPSREGELMSSRSGRESGILSSNLRQQSDLEKIEEEFLLFDNRQTEMSMPEFQAQIRPKLGITNGQGEIRLPEEDSLIAASNPLNFRGFIPGGNPAQDERFSSQGGPFNIAEKLAALTGNFKEQQFVGSEGRLPFHIPFDKREPDPFESLHIQPPSAQLRPHQSNHMGRIFNPLDSYPGHGDSQMKIMTQDNMLHHDLQSSHHLPANMIRPPIHHPNAGFSGFDPPNQHSLVQPMHVTGNFPTPHQFQGFVRGPPVPHHNHQVPGFMHEMNQLQAFPFGHRNPNFGGLEMPQPAPPEVGGGNTHPETLQRLIEMEMLSNAKQMHHPVAAGGGGGSGGGGVHNSQGIYGHELDMGFRYR